MWGELRHLGRKSKWGSRWGRRRRGSRRRHRGAQGHSLFLIVGPILGSLH